MDGSSNPGTDAILARLVDLHPAAVASAFAMRPPGSRAAVGTLLRMIRLGALGVRRADGTVEIHLVPGVTTSRHHRVGPFVEREHIRSLARSDRVLLELLFDEIAHAPALRLDEWARLAKERPVPYYNGVREWRRLARREGTTIGWFALLSARRALPAAIADTRSVDGQWSALAEHAVALGLGDRVTRAARARAAGDAACGSGPSAVEWLCSVGSPPRTALRSLARLLAPFPPSRYLPAQYSRIVLPFWLRFRGIDDGSMRLGE